MKRKIGGSASAVWRRGHEANSKLLFADDDNYHPNYACDFFGRENKRLGSRRSQGLSRFSMIMG